MESAYQSWARQQLLFGQICPTSAPAGYIQCSRTKQGKFNTMTKRFNPPPNWPAPPAGWTPPTGWLPDPAWGPPPEGWQLWVDEPAFESNAAFASARAPAPGFAFTPSKPRKRRPIFWLVLLAIVIALFAGCAIIGSSLSSSSPDSQLQSKDRSQVSQAQVDAATELSERDLALLVKSPDSYSGKTMVVYAKITQFDAATGKCIFRADVAHKKMENSWDYDENSVFRGGDGSSNCPSLDGFVSDDEVRITATSLGSVSYETQIRGNTTVPAFKVETITSVK
jgi:hypothetical protein